MYGHAGIAVLLKETEQCAAEDHVCTNLQRLIAESLKRSVSVGCVSLSSGSGPDIWGFSTEKGATKFVPQS
jgi:hypothetical protein